jgi:hypothetical protein
LIPQKITESPAARMSGSLLRDSVSLDSVARAVKRVALLIRLLLASAARDRARLQSTKSIVVVEPSASEEAMSQMGHSQHLRIIRMSASPQK